MGRQLVPDEHAAIAEICHQQLTVGGSYRGWVIERLAAEPYVCLRETGLPQDELRGRAVLRGNFLKAQHANVSAVRHEERFFAQRRSTLGTAESPFGRLAPVVAFRTSEVLLSDYNLGGRKVRQRFRCVLRTCRTYGQHEKQTHRYAKPNPPHRLVLQRLCAQLSGGVWGCARPSANRFQDACVDWPGRTTRGFKSSLAFQGTPVARAGQSWRPPHSLYCRRSP